MKEPRSGSSKKISNNLVALSSAAILSVYAAGYFRTKAAADRFAVAAAERRSAGPPASPATSIGAGRQAAPTRAAGSAPPAAERTRATSTALRVARGSRAPSPSAVAAPEPSTPSFDATSAQPLPVQNDAAAALPQAAPPSEPPAVADATQRVTDVAAAQAAAPAALLKDGTFAAWGSCEHGTLEVTVVVESGKVASARISTCKTLYSCSIIADLPPRVVSRQSAEVDFISTATESSVAFSEAVAVALAKAK